MDWSKVGDTLLKNGLPLLGSVLFGPAGGAIGGLVSQALGVSNDPDAVNSALSQDPRALEKLRELELNHKLELERLYVENEVHNLKEVNETIRNEVASKDPYVRRMRPTFGYLVAICLAAQVGVGAYVVGWDPASMPSYAQFITALNVPMASAMAVLGVYVNGRTKEKAMDMGVAPQRGIVNKILDKIGG